MRNVLKVDRHTKEMLPVRSIFASRWSHRPVAAVPEVRRFLKHATDGLENPHLLRTHHPQLELDRLCCTKYLRMRGFEEHIRAARPPVVYVPPPSTLSPPPIPPFSTVRFVTIDPDLGSMRVWCALWAGHAWLIVENVRVGAQI
jgi:hypothetical protein